MYRLSNISFLDYGIIASKAPNSTIAVTGLFDMPKRTGKTYHSWPDHYGVEPYVSANEIMFAGRDLMFHGLVKADDKPSAVYQLKNFYRLLNSFEDLVAFETPYGTFQVYVKDEVDVNYIAEGWCKVVMKFREPVVAVPNELLPSGNKYNELGINGIPFKSFGAIVQKTDKKLNRPGTKKQSVSAYGYEGFELTKTKLQKVQLNLVFIHDSFAELKTGINQFHTILASEGLHDINIDMTGRKIWAVDGFKVKNTRVFENKAVAELNCQLVVNDETSLYEEGFVLVDVHEDEIHDVLDNSILIGGYEPDFLLDNNGNEILINNKPLQIK